jgi:hypothetical protein
MAPAWRWTTGNPRWHSAAVGSSRGRCVARLSARITLAGRVIEGRIGPSGKRVYRARIYYRGRHVASRTFPRKRDAQEWERRQVESLRSGVWSDPAAGDRPVREWCDIWLNAQPARQPATERKIRGVIAKQIAETFGRRPLVSVRPSEDRSTATTLTAPDVRLRGGQSRYVHGSSVKTTASPTLEGCGGRWRGVRRVV